MLATVRPAGIARISVRSALKAQRAFSVALPRFAAVRFTRDSRQSPTLTGQPGWRTQDTAV